MIAVVIRGTDVEGGDPLSQAFIERDYGGWGVAIEDVGNGTRTTLTDWAFTRRGAIRVARKWLRRIA